MNKIRRSLSMKLSLSIVLMAAPIFVIALGILFFQSRQFIQQEAEERATSVLNTTTQRVRNYMSAVETATNANTRFVEEYFHPDSLMAISRRIVAMNRHVYGCSISAEPDMFPQCGRYFSVYTVYRGDSLVSMREPAYEYFKKGWYKSPIVLGKACWVDPYNEYGENTYTPDETISSFSKPLYGKGGRLVGIISTDLSFRRLSEAIDSVGHPYPNAYFILIGNDGRYFIHPDTTRLFRKSIFTDADPNHQADLIALGHEMTAGKQGAMHVTINGNLCHVCYRPLPGTDWSLALICPDNDVLKNYHQLVYIISALIIVGLLVILLMCSRVVGRAIRPVNQLVSMTQQMASGNYDNMIPQTDREDAIGSLQNSFATMQQSLIFHMGGIRHTTEVTRTQNEELGHATQLAEEAVRQKSIFIQNVSHQIRTPLNIIMGFAQVLRDSLVSGNASMALPENETATITGMMKHNAAHLNRMVQMLFDSSESGITEELQTHRNDLVSCNEVARECIAHTNGHFPEIDIKFETDLTDDVYIRTSHLYLMRTLRELLYNAAKYSDGKHLSIRITRTDNMIRFTVEDVGPGMSEAAQEVMFNPFTKVDDLTEGLGLGLPLAKRHARSLGGDLLFDSNYHDGCRFIVEMPINLEPTE